MEKSAQKGYTKKDKFKLFLKSMIFTAALLSLVVIGYFGWIILFNV